MTLHQGMGDGPESRVFEEAIHSDSGSGLVFEKRFQDLKIRYTKLYIPATTEDLNSSH